MVCRKHIHKAGAWFVLVSTLAGAAFAQNEAPPPIPPGLNHPGLTVRKQFQRWWYQYRPRSFGLGDIPADAKTQATQTAQVNSFVADFGAARAAKSASAVGGTRWKSLGPAPLNGGQIGATGGTRPMSGRVTSIAVDPANNNRWLIGAAQGGIWETRDAGVSWVAKSDNQASIAIGAIAFAPGNAKYVYVGTGESVNSTDAYAGAGMLKSIDGGLNWTLIGAPFFAKKTFSAIHVDPENHNIIVAATGDGIAGMRFAFPPDPPASGVFRSIDGGANWMLTLAGDASDLAADPTNYNNQYAALGNASSTPINGLYRSTNAGTSWLPVRGPWSGSPRGVGRIRIAIAPSDRNTMYVSIQDGFESPNAGVSGGLLGLWKTSNAWAATPGWTEIDAGATDDGSGNHGFCGWDRAFSSPTDSCWYNQVLSVDPANPRILYAGGIPLWKYDGTSWSEVSKQVSAPTRGIHVDQHAFAWAGNRLIVGNDGGVWSTTDGGNVWNDHNTHLALTQFYYGSVSPAGNIVLGGSQETARAKLPVDRDGLFCLAATALPMRSPAVIRTRTGLLRFRRLPFSVPSTAGNYSILSLPGQGSAMARRSSRRLKSARPTTKYS